MCSVTCTSYIPTQGVSKSAGPAYNNDAFDDMKSETKLEIETVNGYKNDKQFHGQASTDIIENNDDNIEAERKMGTSYRMHYKVGDVPAPHLSFMFGLQQVLLSISSTISIPLIVANEICAGDLHLVKSEIMSTFLFMCGVCTILQTAVGVRLPIIQGGCHKFIPAVAALMALPIWKCPDLSPVKSMDVTGNGSEANFTLVPRFTDDERTDMWQSRMREIQGGIILSALVQVLIGCTGILGLILNFIGPITIVPTITLVGLSLIDVALRFCQVHWGITSLTVCLVFLFSLYMSEIKIPLPAYSKRRKCHITMYPVFKLLPVILAVAISWSVCAILTVTNSLSSDPKSQEYFTRTDARTNVLETAEWFFFPYPGQWGLPTVSVASFMAMLAATMTSIIESVGDYYACARMSCVSPPPTHAVNRGIAIEGFGSILSGIVGSGGATTSYSQNVGAIGFTKVASRRAFQVAGLIFLLCGLCGKFGALLTQLPDPVLGGIVLVSFGMVTAVGLSNLQFVSLQSSRNLVIIGSSLLIGLMAPRYLAANPGCIKTGDAEVDRVLTVLLSTAMFVGGFVGFVLDNTVPGSGLNNVANPNQHGQLCFSCQGKKAANGCSQIKQCSLGEVCFLSRTRTGDNITYDSNCVDKYYCPTAEIYAVGKREVELSNKRSGSVTECMRCCSGDFCNDIDCTSISVTNKPTQPDTSTMDISTIPQPVDGKFGDWSSWTRCPFSCGRDGIQHRFRHCNNPAPQNGGNLCSGARIDTKFCHNVPCCTGPPVITFIDNDTLAHVGDFVRIRCNVSHADSALWEGPKIVGHNFPENVEVIPGINVLLFNNISSYNTGPYRCVAQNACGITAKYVNIGLLPNK